MANLINIGNITMGRGAPLVLISGPCVIEDYETTREIAASLKEITRKLEIPFIFKASYDKANRTSVTAFRGPGLSDGLKMLEEIKNELGIPVLSDVHRISEIPAAARVLDIIQIPAFLCRQTDVLLEVARAGKVVNIKKGQFLAPWDIANVVEKITSAGNRRILITERGTMFGYNNLVVDFRGFMIMRQTGYPVVFDATHSLQLPGGGGDYSSGQPEFIIPFAKAAVAIGFNGLFIETHPEPSKALSDAAAMLPLDSFETLIIEVLKIRELN